MSNESLMFLIYLNAIWLGLIGLPFLIYFKTKYSNIGEAIHFNRFTIKSFIVCWLLSNVVSMLIIFSR